MFFNSGKEDWHRPDPFKLTVQVWRRTRAAAESVRLRDRSGVSDHVRQLLLHRWRDLNHRLRLLTSPVSHSASVSTSTRWAICFIQLFFEKSDAGEISSRNNAITVSRYLSSGKKLDYSKRDDIIPYPSCCIRAAVKHSPARNEWETYFEQKTATFVSFRCFLSCPLPCTYRPFKRSITRHECIWIVWLPDFDLK